MLPMILAGCASYPQIVENWSADMPPSRIFIAEYSRDVDNQAEQSIENYLMWVKRFYQGWVVYDRGWINMSAELSEEISDPVERKKAQEKIHQIGLLIAPEWAKEKESRYIKTSAVSEWGESLLEALSRGQVLELMDSVVKDIALLKGSELTSEEITIERYFPDLLAEDEKDGFFF